MRFLAQQIYFATNTCEYLLIRHKICFAINTCSVCSKLAQLWFAPRICPERLNLIKLFLCIFVLSLRDFANLPPQIQIKIGCFCRFCAFCFCDFTIYFTNFVLGCGANLSQYFWLIFCDKFKFLVSNFKIKLAKFKA